MKGIFSRSQLRLRASIVFLIVVSLLVSVVPEVFATAPSTRVSFNPALPDGSSGWFKTTPKITLTSTETTATISYWWNSGSVTTGTSGAQFDALEGINTLYYYSSNGSENETTQTLTTYVDTIKPTVSTTDPTNTATGVSRTKNIVITFNENILAGADYSSISVRFGSNNHVKVPIRKSISGKTLTIDPIPTLGRKTTYTVAIPANAVKDAAGNSLAAEKSFGFTTGTGVYKKVVKRTTKRTVKKTVKRTVKKTVKRSSKKKKR